MKGLIIGAMLLALVGCGKTLNELKVNGDAAIENTAETGSQALYVIKGMVKKVIGIGKAVYEIGTKVVEDSKDNVVTVKDSVVGATK